MNQDINKRRMLILNRLVNNEHISYQRLSEEFFVSRSSIANDIISIKKLFSKEELSLKFDNSGTYFEGSEIDIQRVLKRVVLQNLDNIENVSCLVDVELFQKINKSFKSAIIRKKIFIPESYIQSIVVSILLIINRSKNTKDYMKKIYLDVDKLSLEFDQYPLVYELLQDIEREHIYKFSPKETQYLTSLIVGSGIRFFIEEPEISEQFRIEIANLIQRISEGLQKDLTTDKRLEEELTIHIFQLLLRAKAKSTLVNPLISEIKKNYSNVYGVVWFTLNDFIKSFNVTLSEDEVGFIAIHIQASVERIHPLIKILIVCPNGIGTSSFISAKIKKILPEIDSIETVSISSLSRFDLSRIDFIISTVDILKNEKKVVIISPLVTSEDMKKIMNIYIDLMLDNDKKKSSNSVASSRLTDRITKNIVFDNFKEKKKAIECLIEKQKFENNELKKLFFDSVFSRENQQSTYLGNGFAIPHGNPKFVEKTSISILILDKPIKWGNQSVDIIVLLMIKENDLKEVEEMMRLIMKGIEDKEWFINKMLEVKE